MKNVIDAYTNISSKWRIWRLDYFWITRIVPTIIFCLIAILYSLFSPKWDFGTILLIYIIFVVYTVSVVIATTIRRFHDMDKSWWYILLLLIPLVNFIFQMLLLFLKWTKGDNRFWADPLITKNEEILWQQNL